MTKENLVIVHSFPTNSIVLHNLTAYIEEYYKVYFIDLLGFTLNSPLEEINIRNYSHALDEKIGELGIKNYIIAGISFGFWVASEAELKGAKAIIAVEPYIGYKSLRIGGFKRFSYFLLIDFLSPLNLEK